MNTENDITIILADDHELIRHGFAAGFQKPGFKLLATAKDGGELLELVRKHKPDVSITDVKNAGDGRLCRYCDD